MTRPLYPGLQTAEKVAAQRLMADERDKGESYHATIPVDGGAATVIRDHNSVSVSVRIGERFTTIVLDDADMLAVARLVVEALEQAAGVGS